MPWKTKEDQRRYRAKHRKHYSELQMQYYWRNRDDIRERVKGKAGNYIRRIAHLWRNGVPKWTTVQERRKNGAIGEELALKMLPKLGFSNILPVAEAFRSAPFDFLAEKNGIKYGIDATTHHTKSSNARHMMLKMMNWLGLKMLYIFISPDFKTYVLKESHSLACRLSFKDIQNASSIRELMGW